MAKQPRPFNPVAIWRDLFDKWETSARELARANMGPAEAFRLFNQFMAMTLRTQQVMGQLMLRTLSGLPAPLPLSNPANEQPPAKKRAARRAGAGKSAGYGRKASRKVPGMHRAGEAQAAAAASAAKPARRTKRRRPS
jgi:hypothetical protein